MATKKRAVEQKSDLGESSFLIIRVKIAELPYPIKDKPNVHYALKNMPSECGAIIRDRSNQVDLQLAFFVAMVVVICHISSGGADQL